MTDVNTDFDALAPSDVSQLSADQLREAMAHVLALQQKDRKENQILYYRPNSQNHEALHRSTARTIGVGGGNRAGKTDTTLAEIVALSTGMLPDYDRDLFMAKFRGPLRVRIVLESLKATLHPVFIPKLQYFQWNGDDTPGGARGHWGWVPKCCLIDGDWSKSWSEKLATLTLLCRDPEKPSRVIGKSMVQFMSHDQDPSDFASGSFHIVMHDEPPPYAIWRENKMRTMDVSGRSFLVMTWPDDPSIPVDWIFDEVYEPGSPGPNKDPEIDWIELHTLDNPHLPQDQVRKDAARMSEAERSVRIMGQPIRFSNLVHPLFTDNAKTWCFRCVKPIFRAHDGKCPECGSAEIEDYCHVSEFEHSRSFPAIFLLDPHPRKPHMFCWIVVDGNDDLWMVEEGQLDGEPLEVRKAVDEIEESLGLNVRIRIMDPNMGASPASAKRSVTWQDEFGDAGLWCELADDSAVGRSRVNEYLKPDPVTHRPRLHVHARCRNTIMQMKRFAWDEYRRSADRDQKQTPRDKYDDMPALLRYCMNHNPIFSYLHQGAPVIRKPGKRMGAY